MFTEKGAAAYLAVDAEARASETSAGLGIHLQDWIKVFVMKQKKLHLALHFKGAPCSFFYGL